MIEYFNYHYYSLFGCNYCAVFQAGKFACSQIFKKIVIQSYVSTI